jgi:hypothetical protein
VAEDLASTPPRRLNPPRLSHLEELDLRAIVRENELAEQREQGYEHPLFEHADKLAQAVTELEGERSGAEARAHVRAALAGYLERIVLPTVENEKLAKIPEKLRAARQQCWFQLNTQNGRTRTIWDVKAGEPLLCPDDARAEGMRLQRRLEHQVEELARGGYRMYYGVLTIENAAPGGLEARVEKLWRTWRKALKARIEKKPGDPRRKKDLPKRFPFIGAIATLEAPLSASRTWHPHLNVILITRGFFDWSDWWRYWGWVSHFEPIKRGNVAAAFRELVKYAVRAVPEKSAEKACTPYPTSPADFSSATLCSDSPLDPESPLSAAGESVAGSRLSCASSPIACAAEDLTCSPSPDSLCSAASAFSSATAPAPASDMSKDGMRACATDGSSSAGIRPSATSPAPTNRSRPPPGPALTEWTAEEFCEWWHVMKGRRRTRTYGELFGLNVAPEREQDDAGAWRTIGKGHWTGTGYRVAFALLECIPGDKSIPNVRERFEKWSATLWHPPDGWTDFRRRLDHLRAAFTDPRSDR